jgi:serine/threonine kinase 16
MPSSSNSSSDHQAQAARRQHEENRRHQEDEEDEMFPQPEGDGEDGYSYGPAVNVPLMTKHRVEDERDVIFDGDEEFTSIRQNVNGNAEPGQTEMVPYAHRDLKPGYADLRDTGFIGLCCNRNVMIADDGTPILMDFGSTVKARIPIENRSQALMQQVRLRKCWLLFFMLTFVSQTGYRGGAKHDGLPCS